MMRKTLFSHYRVWDITKSLDAIFDEIVSSWTSGLAIRAPS
jgi:hypothetical protein